MLVPVCLSALSERKKIKHKHSQRPDPVYSSYQTKTSVKEKGVEGEKKERNEKKSQASINQIFGALQKGGMKFIS